MVNPILNIPKGAPLAVHEEPEQTNINNGQEIDDINDDFDLINVDAEDIQVEHTSADALFKKDGAGFLPEDKALSSKLADQLNSPVADKKDILSFIAENTNPKKIIFGIKNFFFLIADILKGGKPDFVLNKNCVSCAKAVDTTLSSMVDDGSDVRLYQSAISGKKDFGLCVGEGTEGHMVMVSPGTGWVSEVVSSIAPGKRACISVPVLNKPYSHAMNMVRIAGKEPGSPSEDYILCGQTGRVWNFNILTDMEDFCSRYGAPSNDAPLNSVAIVIETGDAPSRMP